MIWPRRYATLFRVWFRIPGCAWCRRASSPSSAARAHLLVSPLGRHSIAGARRCGAGSSKVGDRVLVTDEVPGDPPAGVMGWVSEADPELGAMRVDFPTWGDVRTPLVSALAQSLTQDCAAIVEPEAEVVADAAIDAELDRLGAGVEW